MQFQVVLYLTQEITRGGRGFHQLQGRPNTQLITEEKEKTDGSTIHTIQVG